MLGKELSNLDLLKTIVNRKSVSLIILILLFISSYSRAGTIVYTVSDFGIKSNNTDDYTSAIQVILDKLRQDDNDNIIVYFPKGNYHFSGRLVVKSNNTNILGEDGTKLIFTQQKNVKNNRDGYQMYNRGILVSKKLKNVYIENLFLKGYSENNQVGYAVRFDDFANNSGVKKCIMDGFTGGILYNLANNNMLCEGNVFRNMTFVPKVKAGGYGIVFQSSHNTVTRNNTFESSIYRHAVYYARNQAHLNMGGSGHKFINNTIYGSVQDNYLTGNEQAFKILGNSELLIENNNFIGGVGHIWIVENEKGVKRIPEDIIISNNTFKNMINNSKSRVYGVGVDGNSYVNNLKIVNNFFDKNDVDELIKLQRGSNVNISNNIVNQLESGHFVIVDYGISNLQIINNKVNMNSDYDGIYIGRYNKNLEYQTNVEIRKNVIKNALFSIYAINMIGDIEDNEFHSMNTSIQIESGSFKGKISNNRLFNGRFGVFNKPENKYESFQNNYVEKLKK
ncbi:right-handed parallel beta-helix repeat-containing protein [Sphingobacterium sp.]|uniref:right-handed parallel beta-helix repeat-containing protein n=1 Tax=Sphingobacterium sp. TaxID=341027 RepID=UPI0028A63BED|nr:right-handed parallel beta-helix repeat-containing protein [Sphingobacterium sp.]